VAAVLPQERRETRVWTQGWDVLPVFLKWALLGVTLSLNQMSAPQLGILSAPTCGPEQLGSI